MKKVIAVLIFVVGLFLLLYPTVSNFYNEYQNSLLIDNYMESTENIKADEKEKILTDARTYNKYMYEGEKLEELGLSYNSSLNMYENGIVGFIEIPTRSV